MKQGKLWLTGAAVVCACVFAQAAQATLIAHYRFDEAVGSLTAEDSAGSADGALQGSAAFVPGGGILGGAISLHRATSDLVNMGNNFAFTGGASFSLQAWVKLAPGDTTANFVAGKHRSTDVAGYFLGIGDVGDGCGVSAGKVSFYTAYPCSGGSAISVNDGGWHQVIGMFDASTGTTQVYVDGQFQTSAGGNSIASTSPSTTAFLVGGITFGSTPTSLFDGLVDEVRIYDTALTATEVRALYNATLNPTAAPLPGTLLLFAAGLAGIAVRRRRT